MSSKNSGNNSLKRSFFAAVAVEGDEEDDHDCCRRQLNKKMKAGITTTSTCPPSAAGTTVSSNNSSSVPSLQTLSSIAVQNYILLQRKQIPKEVSKSFKPQRSAIRKQLRQLEIEKKTLMSERMAKLEEDIAHYRQQQQQQMKQKQQPIVSGGESSSDDSTPPPPTAAAAAAVASVSFVQPQIATLCILSERRKILRDAENYCREHKIKLLQKLKDLQNEKRQLSKQRLLKFESTTQQLALLHLQEVKGAPDLFCSKCNYFYKAPDWCANNKNNNTTTIAKISRASFGGSSSSLSSSSCEWCSICPNCFRKEDDDKLPKTTKRKFGSLGIIDCGANGEYYVSEEQQDWPSPNGYVDCWLCNERFCNKSFEMNHYVVCRTNYSNRCGFRRQNKHRCSLYACKRTTGHCGKVLVNSTECNYCRWCTTLYCKDCAPKCKCWDAHCSACTSDICYTTT